MQISNHSLRFFSPAPQARCYISSHEEDFPRCRASPVGGSACLCRDQASPSSPSPPSPITLTPSPNIHPPNLTGRLLPQPAALFPRFVPPPACDTVPAMDSPWTNFATPLAALTPRPRVPAPIRSKLFAASPPICVRPSAASMTPSSTRPTARADGAFARSCTTSPTATPTPTFASS